MKIIGADIISQTVGTTTSFLGYDGHGSTRTLTDAVGAVTNTFHFDGYGMDLGWGRDTDVEYNQVNKPASDMLYSGEQYDTPLQMQSLRARYYDQNVGGFNRLDDFAGNMHDPQSYHKYAYCHGDPTNAIDPTGKGKLLNVLAAITISTMVGLKQAEFAHRAGKSRGRGFLMGFGFSTAVQWTIFADKGNAGSATAMGLLSVFMFMLLKIASTFALDQLDGASSSSMNEASKYLNSPGMPYDLTEAFEWGYMMETFEMFAGVKGENAAMAVAQLALEVGRSFIDISSIMIQLAVGDLSENKATGMLSSALLEFGGAVLGWVAGIVLNDILGKFFSPWLTAQLSRRIGPSVFQRLTPYVGDVAQHGAGFLIGLTKSLTEKIGSDQIKRLFGGDNS